MTSKTIIFASALVLAAGCDTGDGDTSSPTTMTTTTNTTPPATEATEATTPTTDGPDTTEPLTTSTSEPETTDPETTEPETTTPMTTGVGGLSFEADVWGPILSPKCGCHQAGAGSGGLLMGADAATAYAAMVGVASSQGTSYVEAGDAASSYMYAKITGTGVGSTMPLGDALTPEQIATVEQWINEGAMP
jgi:hypothetical protein